MSLGLNFLFYNIFIEFDIYTVGVDDLIFFVEILTMRLTSL